MKTKKLIIDYKKHWGPSGTVYSQTIKISEDLQKKYNQKIRYMQKKIRSKKIFSYDESKILIYTDTLKKGVNYIHLTGLYEFYRLISKIGIDRKILDRNTIIIVK